MSADLKESSVPLAEISQGPNAFEAFLDRNVKGLVAFSVVVAIGAAGFVVFRELEKSKQEEAGAAFVKAKDLAGYQAVVDEKKDTLASGSAMLLLANAQWTGGKQDDSIATLRKFISENPEHPAVSTAKANLGTKLVAQGKTGDAAKLLEEVISDPTAKYIAPLALITLGDIAKAGGDLEKAESTYNKVKSDFPSSEFIDEANRRVSGLKSKPPVEIDAPPAPPAPAGTPATPGNPLPGLDLPPGLSITEAPPSGATPEPAPATPEEAPAAPAESQPAPEKPEP